MKKKRYYDMLINDIIEFVSISNCQTLEQMIDNAYEREIKLELRSKWKQAQVYKTEGSTKNPKTFES